MRSTITKLCRQLFVSDGGESQSFLWHILANTVAASSLVSGRLRTVLYRFIGIDIALSALIRPSCIIRSKHLSIGKKTSVNYSCIFDNRAGIRIGNRVGIGIGVKFINTDHDISDPNCRAGEARSAKICVGDGVYIGSGAVILPGVTIGDGAVVGASALVTSDCEPHGLYLGVPAKFVRTLPRESSSATSN